MKNSEIEEEYKINRIKSILATSIKTLQRNSMFKARQTGGSMLFEAFTSKNKMLSRTLTKQYSQRKCPTSHFNQTLKPKDSSSTPVNQSPNKIVLRCNSHQVDKDNPRGLSP